MKRKNFVLVNVGTILIFLFNIYCISTSTYTYVDENIFLDDNPDFSFSTNSLTRCIMGCLSKGLQFINTDISNKQLHDGLCNCFGNISSRSETYRRNWRLLDAGKCNKFEVCRYNENCATNSPSILFSNLPCLCYLGDVCLSNYGPIKNLAKNGVANLSSTLEPEYPASRAIDGYYVLTNVAHNLAHSKMEDNPWLQVKLPAETAVFKVVIINRIGYTDWEDRINPFQIFIGNTTNSYVPFSEEMNVEDKMVIHVTCEQGFIIGKFIKLQVIGNNKILNIQELIIYGI